MITDIKSVVRDESTSQIPAAGLSQVPWARMAALPVDPKLMDGQRIVSFKRRHPASLAFDIMRTKVLRSAQEHNWRTIGITAPTAGCGKATVAANLAISLAKHEKIRVGLVDLDLRQPRIAQLFGHTGQYTTEEFLRGQCLIEDFLVRFGDNLAVGASPSAEGRNLAELLHGQSAANMMARLRDELGADIIVYNLPSLLAGDDCLGLLPQIEASLLVIGAEFSTVADIDVSERELQSRTRLLGVVLNKCRYRAEQYTNFQV